MYPYKLCLGTSTSLGCDIIDQIGKFSDAGFSGFFTPFTSDMDIKAIKSFADEIGMHYQSIHAPFEKMADMWCEGDRAKEAVEELKNCLRACAENEVGIMVAHAFCGFDGNGPTPEGVENFSEVILEAEKLGVKIALRNTEGYEYLRALMEVFSSSNALGFCFDSGHELCYNKGRDQLEMYGDRLVATSLNDNLGRSSAEGEARLTDDLHLMPFDGVADWQWIAERIARIDFSGPLTFEISRKSKAGRHDNDKYMRMTTEEFIAEAYARACKVAAILKRI